MSSDNIRDILGEIRGDLGHVRGRLEGIGDAIEQHIKADEKKFSEIDQSLQKIRDKYHFAKGGVWGASALIGGITSAIMLWIKGH